MSWQLLARIIGAERPALPQLPRTKLCAWCHHTSSLMMNVLHPNVPAPTLAAMSTERLESDGDDTRISVTNLTPGQHYFAQMFATGPVPAGRSVIITAGARAFDKTYANDMEVHSASDCRWFISALEVRVSP